MNDFQEAKVVLRKQHAQHREVELPELVPGVAGVLILDFEDETMSRGCVNEQRVRLAPAFASVVFELNPRPIPVHELVSPEREEREVFLRLSLISQTDSESSAALPPSYKLWFLREELRAPHPHSGEEVFRGRAGIRGVLP